LQLLNEIEGLPRSPGQPAKLKGRFTEVAEAAVARATKPGQAMSRTTAPARAPVQN